MLAEYFSNIGSYVNANFGIYEIHENGMLSNQETE